MNPFSYISKAISHSPKTSAKVPQPMWKRILVGIWLVLAVVVALITIVAANGGRFNPDWSTIPALLAMTFPAWYIANFIIFVGTFWVKRRWIWVSVTAFLLGFSAWWDFMPLNIFHPRITDENSDRVVNFMSYNTFGFIDSQDRYPDDTNRTASEIINSGADIVCIQEIGYIDDMPSRHLYMSQVDSINTIYPYCSGNDRQYVAILSKYPLKPIDLPQPGDDYVGWEAAEAEICGRKVLIVSTHLQPIGLSNEDKAIYHRLTDGGQGVNISGATSLFYGKLSQAFRNRARQARMLRQQLDSLGYENVILSGDFNDIAGSYAERVIAGDNLHSAFSRAGFGPMITYHANRFYFNIDHVLYGGAMKAVSIRHGKVKSSDHYPVKVTFLFSPEN